MYAYLRRVRFVVVLLLLLLLMMMMVVVVAAAAEEVVVVVLLGQLEQRPSFADSVDIVVVATSRNTLCIESIVERLLPNRRLLRRLEASDRCDRATVVATYLI